MVNQENSMYFNTKALGNLKILALIDNYALIEKMYDTPEKYIIASGFDIKTKTWNFGSYYSNFKDVVEDFTERVLNDRHIQSTKQSVINKLYDLEIVIKELTNQLDNASIEHKVIDYENEI